MELTIQEDGCQEHFYNVLGMKYALSMSSTRKTVGQTVDIISKVRHADSCDHAQPDIPTMQPNFIHDYLEPLLIRFKVYLDEVKRHDLNTSNISFLVYGELNCMRDKHVLHKFQSNCPGTNFISLVVFALKGLN